MGEHQENNQAPPAPSALGFKAAVWWVVAIYVVAAIPFVYGVLKNPIPPTPFEWGSKAAAILVAAAGLYTLLLVRDQLVAQEHQLRANHDQLLEDHKWRTYISYHQLFSDVPNEESRAKMYDLAKQLRFIDNFHNYGQAMPDEAYDSILRECDQWMIVRPYLDAFEKFCGAINAGIVDENYAFSLMATRVIRNFTVFERLIRHYQAGTGTAYIELQKVATRWADRAKKAETYRHGQIGVGSGTTSRLIGPKP